MRNIGHKCAPLLLGIIEGRSHTLQRLAQVQQCHHVCSLPNSRGLNSLL